MNPDDIVKGHCLERKRIPFPQIILVGERKDPEIIEGADIFGADTSLIEFLSVGRSMLVGVSYGPFETAQLNFFQLLLTQITWDKAHDELPSTSAK
jgi:hypothetical protein